MRPERELTTAPGGRTGLSPLFAITASLSALLLFQLEPMLGKRLLPWFGGSPAVWTGCMLFFQATLLAGYAFAHGVVRLGAGRLGWLLASAPFALALCALPVGPASGARTVLGSDASPMWQLSLLLFRHAALPFFALCTVAPLLQHWYARRTGRSPYVLYACSNAGSLLGLLAYPLLVEPWLAMSQQVALWSGLFALVALAVALCGWIARRAPELPAAREHPAPQLLAHARDDAAGSDVAAALARDRGDTDAAEVATASARDRDNADLSHVAAEVAGGRENSGAAVTTAVVGRDYDAWSVSLRPSATPAGHARVFVRWCVLAAVPSAMLLAVTAQLSLDVAAVPLLWVMPLALYLGSFVLTFAGPREWLSRSMPGLWMLASNALALTLLLSAKAPFGLQLASALAALFACCMIAHGALWAARPEPARLSAFYLALALGGTLGGLFVSLVAPLCFDDLYELPLAILASYAILLRGGGWMRQRTRGQSRALWLALGVAVPSLTGAWWWRDPSLQLLEQRRSFHGSLRVVADARSVRLSHGRILHGMQSRSAQHVGEPGLYFGPDAGVGLALRRHALERPRKIGVLGLGVGTLAAYGRAQDHVYFYELDPDVVEAARRHFSFLQRSPAMLDVTTGDGRLLLEQQPPQHFDLLVLDAFSSDSVPVHLLSVEAFASYARQLARDGLLIANVVNRHIDVDRVVAGSARANGLAWRLIDTPADASRGLAHARWMLMARDPAQLASITTGASAAPLPGGPVRWTDDFSNLFGLLHGLPWHASAPPR